MTVYSSIDPYFVEPRIFKYKKMCWDKKRYSSDMEAAAASGIIQFKLNRILKWYSCPLCDGYHLTTYKKQIINQT